ncbi:MAG TPA: glycosyltransferase [Thermoplasmata archaeon]|nr:glycosyltransferase [Thermoplasmata archaeon]
MKVAIVTLRFDAPGGVESNVRAVSKGIVDAGDDVTVYASDLFDEGGWDRRSSWRPRVDGVPVQRFPVTKRLLPGLTMPMMTGLITALSRDRPDVILAHSHRYGHVFECAAVAERLKIPLVVATHYHPADQREPPAKKLLLRLQDYLFGWTAYRTAAAIIIETELERRQLSEFAPSEKLWKVPPGIHVGEWDHPDGDRPPDGLPKEFLLYAGRIARNKGLDGLFQALATIPAERRPPLVIIGQDWGMRAPLERLADALGITGWIHWLGHLNDLGAYRATFRRARLFVLPSEYEAFGIVLLEAMAAGIPKISTDVGGMPEVLEDGRCGRLMPYGDPAQMGAAILAAWDAGPVPREVPEGHRRAREFDWSIAVDRHRAVFRAVVDGRRAPEAERSFRTAAGPD